jgi:hypothetical protein
MKYANPNVSRHLAVALSAKVYLFVFTDFFFVSTLWISTKHFCINKILFKHLSPIKYRTSCVSITKKQSASMKPHKSAFMGGKESVF